jgi:multidrug efflux pump subunit AcrA (membrane-fusion protein)
VPVGHVIAGLDTSALEAEKAVLLTQRQTESFLLDRLKRGERQEVIRAAESEVGRLDVEMKRAETEYERAKRSYANQTISREDYDEKRFTYNAAIHSVEQAQQRLKELKSGTRVEDIDAQSSRVDAIDAQLKQLDVKFEKSVLKAPFDGICVERIQDEGVILSSGQTVLKINEAHRLEARFSIPQSNLGLMAEAKYLEVGGEQYALVNPRAISQVDAMTRTVDIVIPLAVDRGERILPGQTATLTLVKQIEADCVEVPISALVASVRGLWSCYQLETVPQSDSIYEIVKVEVSIIHTDGVRAFVTSTLPDQALIIPEGVHKLVPGLQVRVVDGSP